MKIEIEITYPRHIVPASICVNVRGEILISHEAINEFGVKKNHKALFASDDKGNFYIAFNADKGLPIRYEERQHKDNRGCYTTHRYRCHSRQLAMKILESINPNTISATLLIKKEASIKDGIIFYRIDKKPYKQNLL